MNQTRLFDQDPYLKTFNAKLIDQMEIDGLYHVRLDQTAFYPEGGGQPSDQGTLNGVKIVQLIEKEEQVVHVLESQIQSPVKGAINWQVRFDHMQQHSGQHILSRAIDELIDGKTIGFHLGETLSTIDVDKSDLSDQMMKEVEDRANVIVFQNLPVMTHVLSAEEAAKLPLRKDPIVKKQLRIVEVDGFDWSACCGTHCKMSAEIGLIKILKWEKYKTGTRITFVCGNRALIDYQRKTNVLRASCQPLSVSELDLPLKLQTWQKDRKSQSKKIKELTNQVLDYKASEYIQAAEMLKSVRYIELKDIDYSVDEVRMLSQKLIQNKRCLVLANTNFYPKSFLFARSKDLEINLQQLISPLFNSLGLRGGGRPDWVQAVLEDGADAKEILVLIKDKIFS